jgi:hypothetical protein
MCQICWRMDTSLRYSRQDAWRAVRFSLLSGSTYVGTVVKYSCVNNIVGCYPRKELELHSCYSKATLIVMRIKKFCCTSETRSTHFN